MCGKLSFGFISLNCCSLAGNQRCLNNEMYWFMQITWGSVDPVTLFCYTAGHCCIQISTFVLCPQLWLFIIHQLRWRFHSWISFVFLYTNSLKSDTTYAERMSLVYDNIILYVTMDPVHWPCSMWEWIINPDEEWLALEKGSNNERYVVMHLSNW